MTPPTRVPARGPVCLPVLDGTRASTDARLAAWLGEAVTETVEDAVTDLRETVDELADLAKSRTGRLTRTEQADDLHGLARDALARIEAAS